MPRKCSIRPSGKRETIAVLLDISFLYNRRIAAGIAEFCRKDGRFEFNMIRNEQPLHEQPSSYAGLITHVYKADIVAQARSLGIPLVNISSRNSPVDAPSVINDDRTIGRMGARHLIEKGYRTLRFLHLQAAPPYAFSEDRWAGFMEEVARAGVTPTRHDLPILPPGMQMDEVLAVSGAFWEGLLGSITGPVGIMACNDGVGHQCLQQLAVRNPALAGAVAIIGVDDEPPVLNEESSPGLSSVRPNFHEVGFRAAELLASISDGNPASPSTRILIPPEGIIERDSTAKRADANPIALRAIQWIVQEVAAGRAFGVEDVASAVGVSRRTLTRYVASAFPKGLRAEITRLRIDKAKELLRSSDLSISQVAERCAYTTQTDFGVAFKKAEGVAPREYRTGRRHDTR